MNLNKTNDLGFPDWQNPIRYVSELYKPDVLGKPQPGATQKVEESNSDQDTLRSQKKSLKQKFGNEYERKLRLQ